MRFLTKWLLAGALVAPGLVPAAGMPSARAASVVQPDDQRSKEREQAERARQRFITRALLQRHAIFEARLAEIARMREAREAREAAERAAREEQRRSQMRFVTGRTTRSTTSGGASPTFVTGSDTGGVVISAGSGAVTARSTGGSGGGGSGGGGSGGGGSGGGGDDGGGSGGGGSGGGGDGDFGGSADGRDDDTQDPPPGDDGSGGGDGSGSGDPFADVTFWVWMPASMHDMPTFEEPYWQDPRVFPLIQPNISWPDIAERHAPGRRPPLVNTQFERVNSWEGKNPELSAEQLLSWAAYYDERLEQIGRSEYKWTFHLNGFGALSDARDKYLVNRRNAWTLGRNPLDRLYDPELDERAQTGGFFSAEGRRLNSEWTRRFIAHFESRRGALGVEPPASVHMDLEGIFDMSTIDQWWAASLETPRAHTELIDGEKTLAQYAAEAPPFFPEYGTYAIRNHPFLRWAVGVKIRCEDWVMWDAFFKHVHAAWGDIPISNYDVVPGTREHPYPMSNKGMDVNNAAMRYLNCAAPVTYPIEDWAVNGVFTSVADQAIRFGLPADATVGEVSLALGKARLNASVGTGMRTAPWIIRPTEDGMTVDQTAALIAHALDLGVKEIMLFSGHGYDWSEVLARADQIRTAGVTDQ